MGLGCFGPSVKLLSLEAAAGSVGATPPGPPSLPSWGLVFPKARKLPSSLPSRAGSISRSCANSGGITEQN